MTISEQPSQYGHGYVFDQESAAEKARLLLQDRLINEAVGGLIPELKRENVQKLRNVLVKRLKGAKAVKYYAKTETSDATCTG